MLKSKVHFFHVFLLLVLGISFSCEPEEQHPIPDVYINFTINLNTDPSYFRLLTIGNSVVVENTDLGILNLGYENNGVIIYSEGDEFYSYDLTCPHDIPDIIKLDIDGSLAECPQCESRYVFSSSGAPTISSVSRWPLKEYKSFYNPNTGDLVIRN